MGALRGYNLVNCLANLKDYPIEGTINFVVGYLSRWWFQKVFLMFTSTWGKDPI